MQRVSSSSRPCLLVLLGSTGVGKTALSIRLAQYLGCDILSADSRQIYRDLPIGTAAPSAMELAAVPHHFVGTHTLEQGYSAACFEEDALALLSERFQRQDYCLVSGGSMMYLDALCQGLDAIPNVQPSVREAVWERYQQEGLEAILQELKLLDPIYYQSVDQRNYKRVLHGYEVCISSGRPFSSFHTQPKKERPFHIIKLGLCRDREELYERIDQRVLTMIDAGLLEEARRVYPYRHLNALNTVGYKELFAHFAGEISLEEAIRLIQRNSRHYARKQLTWWKRDASIRWHHPDDWEGILEELPLAK